MSATRSELASLDELTKTPYIQVLTYPAISIREARFRVRQLESLRVEGLVFEGKARVGRLGVLGIGTVGIVVRARRSGETFALKIRRIDANRHDMEAEVKVTTMANRVGVGPEIFGHTKDMILMKLIESQEIGDWLKELGGKGMRQLAREMIHALLNQCRKLDIMGIDHGQLSNLRKHAVISEGRPWIIDFESAATGRRPKNVTTAAQYLFLGGAVSPLLRRTLGIRDVSSLTRLLGEYKREMADYSYSKILEHLRLIPS